MFKDTQLSTISVKKWLKRFCGDVLGRSWTPGDSDLKLYDISAILRAWVCSDTGYTGIPRTYPKVPFTLGKHSLINAQPR